MPSIAGPRSSSSSSDIPIEVRETETPVHDASLISVSSSTGVCDKDTSSDTKSSLGRARNTTFEAPMYLYDVHQNSETIIKHLHLNGKLLMLIRHGESEANVETNEWARHQEKYRDAMLTKNGQGQARALQKRASEWGMELVITSPLTRAVQTACLVFEKESVPIQSKPLVSEFYPQYPECQGRSLEQLRKDANLTSLRRFSSVDFSEVPEQWWEKSGDRKRLLEFMSFLKGLPQTKICVVSHWGFIRGLIRAANHRQNINIHNCTWIQTVWAPQPHPTLHATDSLLYGVVLTPSGNHHRLQLLDELLHFRNKRSHQRKHSAQESDEASHGSKLHLDSSLLHIRLSRFIPLQGIGVEDMAEELWHASRKLLALAGAFAWTLAQSRVQVCVRKTQEGSLPSYLAGMKVCSPELSSNLSCLHRFFPSGELDPENNQVDNRIVNAFRSMSSYEDVRDIGVHPHCVGALLDEKDVSKEELSAYPELFEALEAENNSKFLEMLNKAHWKICIVSSTSANPIDVNLVEGCSFSLHEDPNWY